MKSIILIILVGLHSANGFASEKVTVLVEGMTCPMCAGKVESNLKEHPEISDIKIDIDSGKVIISTRDNATIGDKKIRAAIKKAGYKTKEIKR